MTAGRTTTPARVRRRPSAEFLQIWEEGYVARRRAYEEMHLPSMLLVEGAPLRGDDGRLDRARILTYVEAVIGSNPRFRVRLQRPFLGLTPPAWVPDDRFDVSRHLRFSDEVIDIATADLRRLGGADDGLMPIDHPLWRLRITELADGRVAIGMVTHHVTNDGLGAMKTMSDMCQKEPGRALPDPSNPFAAERAAKTIELPGLALLRWWKRQPTLGAAWTSYWSRPITKRARRALARVVVPIRYNSRRPDARTSLPARHSSFRIMEASAATRYARELGGTISDLLLAAMLTAWKGPESEIKARFPVSLRTAEQSHIRNHVRDMEIRVATDLDLAAVISTIREQVDTRDERDAAWSASLGTTIGYATFLPWVSTPRYFAGARVVGVTPTPASLATDQLSALGILYDGKIFIGATMPVERDVEATTGRMYELMTGHRDPGRP